MTERTSDHRFSGAQLRTTGAVLLGVGIVLMLALGVNVGGAVASVVFLVGVVLFIVGSLRVRRETKAAATAAEALPQTRTPQSGTPQSRTPKSGTPQSRAPKSGTPQTRTPQKKAAATPPKKRDRR